MRCVTKALLAVVIFALLSCAFFWKFILYGQVPIAADILGKLEPWKTEFNLTPNIHNDYLWDNIVQYYPLKHFIAERLKSGEIPLWNPMGLCGNPMLGSGVSGLLYPFNLLFAIMSVPTAFAIFDLLHIFMAGFFMWVFLRIIGCNRFGAFTGGIVFMFNGFIIVWMEHISVLSTIIWLPIILTLIEQIIKTKRFLWIFLCGISIGIQFLAGFPQVSLYILIGVTIYALVRVFQLWDDIKNHKSVIYRVGLAIIIGFSIGAVQLLPIAELADVSQRNRNNWLPFPLINPAVLLHMVTFLIPDVFGNPVDHNYWGATNYIELCGYIGVIPLLFCLSLIFEWRNKQVLPFLILSIFAILVYIRTPLERILYLIPGYSHELSSSRVICLYTFAGSVLSGLGMDYLTEPSNTRKMLLKLRSISGYMLLATLIVSFIWSFILIVKKDEIMNSAPGIVNPVQRNSEPDIKIVANDFLNVAKSSWNHFSGYYRMDSPIVMKQALILFLFFLLVILILKKKISMALGESLLLALVISDLFSFGMKFITFVKPETVYSTPKSISFLKNDIGSWRAMPISPTFPANSLMTYGIQDINGYGWFQKRYEKFVFAVDKNAMACPGDAIVSFSDCSSKLIDLLNVKYVITKDAIPDTDRFSLIYDNEVKIYKNNKVIPRAFVVSSAKVIQEETKILAELVKPDFDIQNCVLLEEYPENDITFRQTISSKVSIISYAANSITLDVKMINDAFLVLTDVYYPGWKAYIDGRQTKIYRGNYIFRTIWVPLGEHKIEFIYSPLSFKFGGSIAIFALVFFPLLTVFLGNRASGFKKHLY